MSSLRGTIEDRLMKLEIICNVFKNDETNEKPLLTASLGYIEQIKPQLTEIQNDNKQSKNEIEKVSKLALGLSLTDEIVQIKSQLADFQKEKKIN